MRRLTRHSYIHSSLSIREFRSGTPTVNVRYRVTRRNKPSHMWRRSKRNGRTLKLPRLLVILTRVSLYTTFTKRTNCHSELVVLPFDEENEQDMAFFPINPCCKSLFDRRVQVIYALNVISPNARRHARTRQTACQQ